MNKTQNAYVEIITFLKEQHTTHTKSGPEFFLSTEWTVGKSLRLSYQETDEINFEEADEINFEEADKSNFEESDENFRSKELAC